MNWLRQQMLGMPRWVHFAFWIAIAGLIAVLVTGCGGDHYQKEKIGHGYSVVEVPYHGRTIDCIMRSSDTKDGYTVRSLSCDFVAFHEVGP